MIVCVVNPLDENDFYNSKRDIFAHYLEYAIRTYPILNSTKKYWILYNPRPSPIPDCTILQFEKL